MNNNERGIDMNKCDECGTESNQVKAGRWIFYCPAHKQADLDKTYDNEIEPSLESGELPLDFDGDILEVLI
jgi:hypothetical protein